jgi:hypothetical protein
MWNPDFSPRLPDGITFLGRFQDVFYKHGGMGSFAIPHSVLDLSVIPTPGCDSYCLCLMNSFLLFHLYPFIKYSFEKLEK